jgi:hypothetical protein
VRSLFTLYQAVSQGTHSLSEAWLLPERVLLSCAELDVLEYLPLRFGGCMSLSNLKGGRVGEQEAQYHEVLNCGVLESLETDALHFCTMRSWRQGAGRTGSAN